MVFAVGWWDTGQQSDTLVAATVTSDSGFSVAHFTYPRNMWLKTTMPPATSWKLLRCLMDPEWFSPHVNEPFRRSF